MKKHALLLFITSILLYSTRSYTQSISVPGESYCGPATVDFTATGPNCADYKWYDQASGGNLLGTGCNFTSPPTTYNHSYFVASPHMVTTEPNCSTIEWFDSQTSTTPVGTGCNYTETATDIKDYYYVKQPGASFTTMVGYPTTQFTGTANGRTHYWTTNTNNEKYAAYFDVKQTIVLNSVDVQISAFSWVPCSAFFRIELRDQNNTLLQSSNPTTPCSSGDQVMTIPLGWTIAPDVNYSLKLVNVYNNQYVYVTTSGADYSVGGPLDNPYLHITSGGKNMSPNANPNAWGGLYNWNITVDPRVAIPNRRSVAFALDTCNLTCGDSIDLNTWTQRGDPASGNWTVNPAGNSVFQSVNAPSPTFFVSPEDFINVQLTGSFVTTGNDNDWMGFVFGYRDPIDNPTSQIYYLFDWAQDISYGSHLVNVGMVKDLTTVSHNTNAQDFWSHQSGIPGFNILSANTGAGSGWQMGVQYNFVLDYTSTHVTVVMNGGTYNNDTIVDMNGCFQPGRFGFYNFSQADVTYSDFTWKMIADYNLSATTVCQGEAVDMTALQNASCGGGIVSNIAEWNWDISDGTSIADTNVNDYTFDEPGNYSIQLTIKDTVGCQAHEMKSIHVLPGYTPNLNPDALAICSGSATNVNATGYSGANYEWFEVGSGSLGSPTTNDSTTSFSTVGDYYVRVTGSLGCDGISDTISLAVDSSPTPSIAPDQVLCFNDTVTFTTPSTSNTLEWGVDLADSVSVTGNSFQVGARNQDFTVEVTESTTLGCATTDQLLVQVNERIDTSNYLINCNTNDFTVQFDLSGGDIGTYSVSGLTGTFSGNTWTSDVVADGSSFSLNISDQYNCNSIAINDFRQCSCVDSASLSGDTALCGTNHTIPLTIEFNQAGNFSYELFKDGQSVGVHSNVASPHTVQVVDDGLYTIDHVTQSCFGTGTGSANVVYNSFPPTPSLNTLSTICQNDTIQVVINNAQNNVNWNSSNAQILSSPSDTATIVSGNEAPIITVEHESAFGCLSSLIDTLNFSPQSTPPTLTDDAHCQFSQAQSISAIGDNITWYSSNSFNDIMASTPTVDHSIIGVNTFFATQQVSGECRSDMSSVNIEVLNLTSTPAPLTFDYCLNETSSAVNINGTNVQWYSDSSYSNPINPVAPNTTSVNTEIYYYTENNGTCESLLNQVVLNINDLPSPSTLASKDSACPQETVTFSINGNIGSTFNWNLNGQNLDTSSTSSGDLSLVLGETGQVTIWGVETDENGCVDSSSATTQIYNYSLPIISTDDTTCHGDSFIASVHDRGGNYNWTSNTSNVTLTNSTSASATFESNTSGFFEIQVTETITGCSLTTTATGFIEGATPLSLNFPSDICELDGPMTLSATPIGGNFSGDGVSGTTYDHQTGNTQPGLSHYITYTYTSEQGCISTDSTSITVNPAPTISITGDTSICGIVGDFDLFVNSDQTGLLTFDLNRNGQFVSTHSDVQTPYQLSVQDSGTYSISNIQQSCAGLSTGNAIVEFRTIPSPPALSTADPICLGESFSVNASGVLNNLQWSSSPSVSLIFTSNMITVSNTPGDIEITATHDADNGCSSSVTQSFSLSQPSPIPNISDQISCENSGTVQLTASGDDIIWYTAPDTTTSIQGLPMVDGTTAGDFEFFATQRVPGMCLSEFANPKITITPLPSPPADITFDYCLNIIAEPINILGTAIAWYSDQATTNPIPAVTPLTNMVSTNQYFVTQTEANCESLPGIVTVNVHNLPTPSLAASKMIGCPQESITYTAQVGSGSQLNWFEDNEDLNHSSLSMLKNLPNSGTVTISITETDLNGCSSSTSLLLNTHNDAVQELPAIDTSCIGDQLTLSVIDRQGTYTWNINDPNVQVTSTNNESISFTGVNEGDFTISLTEVINGCTLQSSTSGVVTGPENLVFNTPFEICEDATPLTLAASPSGGKFGGPGVTNNTFNASSSSITTDLPTPLTYTFTTKHGCQSVISTDIIVRAKQQIELTASDSVLCDGQSIEIESSTTSITGVIQWFMGNDQLPNSELQLAINEPGTYSMKIDDGICKHESNQLIIYEQQLFVNTETSILIDENDILEIDPDIEFAGLTSSYEISWTQNNEQIGTGSSLETAPEDGIITATVTSVLGCSTSHDINIQVIRPIKIPNAFTPNGDGIHDVWHIAELDKFTDVSLQVFNRWGELVHESFKPQDWDGTLNGKQLPTATYYYVLHVPFRDEPYDGNVSIVR